MDWQETLERAIPQPPPTHPDLVALVTDGKKRVRRRRIVTTSGIALAAAAMVAGTATVLNPIGEHSAPLPQIAIQPSPSSTPAQEEPLPPLTDEDPLRYSAETGAVELAKGWRVTDRVTEPTGKDSIALAAANGRRTYFALFAGPDGSANYGEPAPTTSFADWVASTKATDEAMAVDPQPDLVDGKLVLSHGWRSVREVPNPMEYAPPMASVGAVIEREGTRKWILVASDGDGAISSHDSEPTASGIESWLPGVVDLQRGLDDMNGDPSTPDAPDPVSFDRGEHLAPAPGVRIHEQVASPDLGPDFASAGARTAAARITSEAGERYVVVREVDGVTDVIARSGRFDTLADFVAFAKEQYADGSGLR